MTRLLITIVAALLLLGCTSNAIDEAQACGVISVFSKPPETQDLYPVIVRRIDDRGVVEKPTYKLAVGKHVIKLNDVVTDRRLRVQPRNRSAQYLEVQVEANKKYHLASRFFPDRRYTNQGDYWAPEVWRVTDETCNP